MCKKFDVVINGGGLTACALAVHFARSGYRVAVVEQRGFLGREVTAALRPWDLDGMEFAAKSETLEELKDILSEASENRKRKRELYQWLLTYGVEVYFCLQPCALLLDVNKQNICGLLLGSKWGYFLIEGGCVIDAEQTQPLLRMLSSTVWVHSTEAKISVCCDSEAGQLAIPCQILLPDLTATVHEWNQKIYIDFRFSIAADMEFEDICVKAQETAFRGLQSLKRQYPESRLLPRQIAYEPIVKSEREAKKNLQVKNLYHIYAGEDFFTSAHDFLSIAADFVSCCQNYSEPAEFVNRNTVIPISACTEEKVKPYEERLSLTKLRFSDLTMLPVCGKFDVVIAGGGTAGVAAAIASARSGAKTMVLDALYGFGGTQTYGLVGGYYYHGYVNGFAAMQTENMNRLGLGASPTGRLLWYQYSLGQEGVQRWCGACVCGVTKRDDSVTGVIVVKNGVWGIVSAAVTVDATGDGDLIQHADLPFNLGGAEDGNTQDSSQWNLFGGGYDLDVIYQVEYPEVRRGLHMAHRLSNGEDFSVMLFPREGRTFCGEYTLNMRDILLERRFSDTIAMAFTDNDPHGGMSATLNLMGLTPYHDKLVMCEIPYRCCIPKGIKGLLAASKSIGATQDAAAYLRMAADVQNRGYAIGMAAGLAVKYQVDVRDIPMAELRSTLWHMQILPCDIHEEKTKANMETLTEMLMFNERDALRKIVCMPSEMAVPVLRNAFRSRPKNLPLSIALGWFGQRDGIELLLQRFHDLVQTEDIECYDDRHPNKAGNNRGGILGVTEDYWRINQLLTVFAILREPSIISEVKELMMKFTAGGAPRRNDNAYIGGRIDLHRIPHYDRMRCVIYYVNCVPSAEYCKPLELLLEAEYMGGYISDGYTEDCGGKYQSVYLETAICECLARCGSVKGAEMLEKCMTDTHYIIRKKAYEALQAIAERSPDRLTPKQIDKVF